MQVKTGQWIDQTKGKLESAKIRFVHPVDGYTLLNQNTKYGHTFRIKIFNLTERIERRKENWCEHIVASRSVAGQRKQDMQHNTQQERIEPTNSNTDMHRGDLITT
jgi:hypothetical protein